MLDSKIFRYKYLKSTNSKIVELQSKEKLDEFSIVITSCQTAGRGQQGNFWESENRQNLTFSMIFYPKFIKISNLFDLTCIVTVGMIDALELLCPNIKIKWANDIYVENKKIAGILIENRLIGDRIDYSIVGIGLNVNQTNFLRAPNPTSLKLLLGSELDKEKLLIVITDAIKKRYCQGSANGIENIRKIYHSRLFWIGEKHIFQDKNGLFIGTISGVDKTGHLIVIDSESREKKYSFKEITYIN